MTAPTGATQGFSLAEGRAIVRDLFEPRPWIYWGDFLTTILIGHVCAALARSMYDWQTGPPLVRVALAAGLFAVQCVCFYRGVMFIHELVHLPERRFVAFRVAWNLLCGIPFLVPSFTYASHLDHHRRRLYGTAADGEYLPLAGMSRWWMVVYLSQCLWVPPLAVLRFGFLTPLTWFSPRLRTFIHQRASSLVMDPRYLRPLPTAAARRWMRLQELGCLVVLIGYVTYPRLVLDRWPIPLLIQGYLAGVTLVLMNCVRTLVSHRWSSNGKEGSFVDQMLDSVTLDSESLLARLLNPVGLRYHATHHLFPSLPYHNMREAHRRLLEQLPADSPYRQTVARSLWRVLADLWHRAGEHHAKHTPSGAYLTGSKLAISR